ncbi:MAG: thiamine phosphate synthase [Firmicutes bacterium]|nr:thiamine phosphate synthase [Bacillota bacterium]
MKKLWRIVDAELNRIGEGLRILEDLARFYYENPNLTSELKQLRSKAAALANPFRSNLLKERDAERDPGRELSQKLRLDSRQDLSELLTANFKRIQEGLRSLEECLKILDYYETAKEYENLRFQAYSLEKEAARGLFQPKRPGLPRTDLYCLTASEFSMGRSNLDVVEQMLRSDIKIIQYREKEKSLKEKYRECSIIRELTADYGAALVVNDDLHLAMAVEADGVHLGQDDLPVEAARQLVGDRMFIGLSTHSPEQAEAAVKAGADYIGVGPIYQTFTKKDVCAPVGLEYLDYVVQNIRIPFVAIGGIKEHNVAEVVRHGAECVALVTEIVGAEDIGAKIRAIRKVMQDSKGEG